MRILYILLTQFLFCISSTFASDEIPENFAKVRIWNSNFSDQEAGHVSLQTRYAYLSFWPHQADQSTTYFSVPNRGDKGFVKQAPGIASPSYEVDLKLEGRESDHTYYVHINSNAIETMWHALKHTYGPIEVGNGSLLFDRVKWYAPGENVGLEDVDRNNIYFNCASLVILALETGGLKKEHVVAGLEIRESWKELAHRIGNMLSRSKDDETKKLGEFITENYPAARSILPSYVKDILDRKIKEELEIDVRQYFEGHKVQIIPEKCNVETTYSKIVEELSKEKSQLYKNSEYGIGSLTDQFGAWSQDYDGNSVFYLNDTFAEEVVRTRRNQMGGLCLAGTALGGMKIASKKFG